MYGSWRNAMSRVAARYSLLLDGKLEEIHTLMDNKRCICTCQVDDITRLTKVFEKNKTNVDYYCNGV
ncbi:hypothetical protein ACFWMS_12675 [Peribacillus butanolivorans]|uniref:hypothetical protein n=1 Tax=Peribacillus butanolivorans TaxID=421767 RepID=UPI003666FCA8